MVRVQAHLGRDHCLVALSANFTLYGDTSERMMSIVGSYSPHQEVYSIDETFLRVQGLPGVARGRASS